MSAVNDVQITGVSVTASNEVTVNLRHGGSGISAAVTIVAITNPMSMMQGSMGNGKHGNDAQSDRNDVAAAQLQT